LGLQLDAALQAVAERQRQLPIKTEDGVAESREQGRDEYV